MTSSFTPECAALLAPIIQQFQDHVNAFFATLAAPPDAATFAAWEATAQQIGQAAAATLLQAALDHTRRQHDANPTPPRCACGAPLHYKGTFPRTLQTLVGLVTVRRG